MSDDIKSYATIGISIAGMLAAAGAWLQKVRSHGSAIKELQGAVAAIPEDIKRRLYDDDSQPIYLPVKRFEKIQKACSTDIKEDIKKIDKKLDKLIDLHMNNSK